MNAKEKDRALFEALARILEPGSAFRGLDLTTAHTLRLAQLTLHRWAEEMCNGTIQRREKLDNDGLWYADGEPYRWTSGDHIRGPRELGRVPDRERGALARVEKVCREAGLHWYHQTDPRGCALYVAAEPLTDQNYSTKGIPCL